jgi:hypothetical protein
MRTNKDVEELQVFLKEKQKEVDANTKVRERALSEDSTQEDQMAFLRGLAERSLNM